MNCVNHSETPASAFCRDCGKPMCQECQREALGSVYCAEHLPAIAMAGQAAGPPPIPNAPERRVHPTVSPYTAPYAPPADPSVHPVLALILGLAPGVGAIYNGQYAKGLVHAVVFGLMVSFVSSTHHGPIVPLVGIMIGVWVIYQAFEAYHTARKRRFGLQVEEFSSLFDVRPAHGRFPAGAILMIGLGFILLLNTTDIISLEVFARYWPALMIAAGVYLLYARLNPAPRHTISGPASPDGSVRR
jgi:hypothetical protein